ncbi:sensor histidine kinase [Streptomyces iconiensis]|uniref:ATP-binding protein n=1 Tax=Streptomyces iconiensis TaxID=1384038 RepID=A0ABT6ZPX6_9ACTN|nr:ATP-binding protein [Streptomyces iconiensis]MDJ1131103.1 ATP-binding protein [Streptomyces iconiensis]
MEAAVAGVGAAAVPRGPAESEFARFAHAYGHRLRAVVSCAAAVLAVLAMPVRDIPLAAVLAAAAIGWNLLYYRVGTRRPGSRALLVADLGVLTALCLSQALTVPDTQTMHGSTWILVTVSIAAVAYQTTETVRAALVASLVLAMADLAGAALDRADGWTYALPNAGWLLVEALLARGLYQLILFRSRSADTVAATMAAERREHAVDEALRREEREYLATLHDTACATLLMASVRGEAIRPEVLAAQAREDLQRLTSERVTTGGADVAGELAAELAGHALHVDSSLGEPPGEPLGRAWSPAVAALRDSLGEALRNVARHAGVDRAGVTAYRSGDTLVVTVTDEGGGFRPDSVPEHRRGLARSVVGRMAAVGGRATISSRPGQGTTVRLEWPHG